MSMEAICFTSSGSNGGCWVFVVFTPPPVFFEKGFFVYTHLIEKKNLRDLYQKNIPPETKVTYPEKQIRDLHRKRQASYAYFHNQATLSSFHQARIQII